MRLNSMGRLSSLFILAVLAMASFVTARSAIAGKMGFLYLSGIVNEAFDVQTGFDAETGFLSLSSKGSHAEALKIEVVNSHSSAGRSPASGRVKTPVIKRLLLTRATSINLATLARGARGPLRVRVLAP